MNRPLRSMTGFGRGTVTVNDRRFSVEARSLNHRGLDVKIRGRDLEITPEIELELLRAVQKHITRGSVSLQVREENLGGSSPLDAERFRATHAVLEKLRLDLGIATPIDMATVATVIANATVKRSESDFSWNDLRPAVEQALAELIAMRSREGHELMAELKSRLEKMTAPLERIFATAAELPLKAGSRLAERLAAIPQGAMTLDPARLAQEVALLADRLDVTEEIVRLRSHLPRMAEFLAGKEQEATGRKIDFLVQEIGREINTIGSKAQDATIATLVVEAKAELEKLREQAQNIE